MPIRRLVIENDEAIRRLGWTPGHGLNGPVVLADYWTLVTQGRTDGAETTRRGADALKLHLMRRPLRGLA